MSSSDSETDINNQNIDSLIEVLKSKDGIARQNARIALVKIGEPTLDALITAFEVKKDPLHWEVAKALSQIGTAKAAQTLVDALEDQEFSVRWMAAEGLINIGEDGLIPLLKALRKRTDSIWLREGAHHVIHDLVTQKLVSETAQECLIPVLDALNHFEAVIQTNTAADRALKILDSKNS
jgi:HEAT repeat protein